MDWRGFWNEDHSIYVSARHRALHADLVAQGIGELLPPGEPRVLDWGCGEALAAETVAIRCERLYLYDSAPRVRDGLRRRFGESAKIVVLDNDEIAALPDGALDVVTIVSVAQYLTRDEFAKVLAALVPKLACGGRLIVADIIPPNLSPLVDARALLFFAWRGGFLRNALVGLVKTVFSNYRILRNSLGLTQWSQTEMIAQLQTHRLSARRLPNNIGHNGARMTFEGTRPA